MPLENFYYRKLVKKKTSTLVTLLGIEPKPDKALSIGPQSF